MTGSVRSGVRWRATDARMVADNSRSENTVKVEGERSVDIAADAEAVWDIIADVTRTNQLSPLTTRADWIPPATGAAVGARFTGKNRLPVIRKWTSTSTVTVCDRGKCFAFVVGTDPADPTTRWTYTLERTLEGGTKVTETWRMVREYRIVLAYFRLVRQDLRIARGVEVTLSRLKSVAEGSSKRNQ